MAELVQLLIDHGADATPLSAEHKGVLEYAAMNPKLKDHPVLDRMRETVGE